MLHHLMDGVVLFMCSALKMPCPIGAATVPAADTKLSLLVSWSPLCIRYIVVSFSENDIWQDADSGIVF
jgi:hypothetical protein